MKKTILFAAAASIFVSVVSCQKEKENNLVPGDKTVFTGAIENTTKTTLDAKKVLWDQGDQVNINGSVFSADNAGVSTTFTGEELTADSYAAIYPSGCFLSDTITFNLPSEYNGYIGGFNHIPMWASSKTKTLTFKNIFAVVKVTVSEAVSQVTVSSDLNLNGNFTVSDNVATISENGTTTTTLVCGSTQQIFYIPIPAANYKGKNLRVTITKDDNTNETMSTKQTVDIDLNANKIISFNFTKNSFNLKTETKTTLL